MPHILKNRNIEIHIDLPLENYRLSRFDWTGKISVVKYKNIYISGFESMDEKDNNVLGKGFYNEFGIDSALAYHDTNRGDWFHKIGIGLLKKDHEPYLFSKNYNIQPAKFQTSKKSNAIIVECKSPEVGGYAYILKKEIELLDSGFSIKYFLKNTGKRFIKTNEYNHNFLAINKDFIGGNYILEFPFPIKPKLFEETINPEGKVKIGQHKISFNNTPHEQFFFSNLSGGERVDAYWELIHKKSLVGIRETGSFKTSKINLWGSKHVISPELFFDLSVKPNQTETWTRTFNLFQTN